jgi:beta-glucosidase
MYKNPKAAIENRVEDLLRRMTAEEKAAMVGGAGWMETRPNERLGIPMLKMADGPLGVRNWAASSAETSSANSKLPQVNSTAFPAGIAMAATWDPELVRREGQEIAREVKALGRDMILGPTVNINRVPLWGRNFEGYGEDPYLAAQLGVAYIKGVQSEGVIATVKHFAANNQEFERHRIDEAIDERALNEIYFPAFKAAVGAGVWSVMSAYNKVNGKWCAENSYLLTETLKKRWGFKGFVVSDWGSTYSTASTLNASLDLEMPGGEPMVRWLNLPRTKEAGNGGGWLTSPKVLEAVKSGQVSQATVDDAVRRILRVMFTVGLFEHSHSGGGSVDTAEQRALARTAATESIVLLKNAGAVLPLTASRIQSIAVIGPNAAVARTGGGGSSRVNPNYAVSPLDGIKERAGSQIRIAYAQGVSIEGEEPDKETAQAAEHLRREAVDLAGKSEAAVVVVGYAPNLESEGFDRKSMDLPKGQDDLIRAVAAANKNTVVVIVSGSPVTATRWIDGTPAVLMAWYSGQEEGHAIADVLFGAANPSGKLPVTWPRDLKDVAAHKTYPGTNLRTTYNEGIFVGYRGFDASNTQPLFPFGYGLSYTTFEYSGLSITPAKLVHGQSARVRLTIRNTGTRPGTEIVQLYVHDGHSNVPRPPRELKGLQRVSLSPGESRTVEFTVNQDAFSFYSNQKHDWAIEPGSFDLSAGSSSRDLRLTARLEFEK